MSSESSLDDADDVKKEEGVSVNTPLLGAKDKTQVYARRWWVLFVFSMSCFIQALVWNTFGPITQSAKMIFHWEDSTVGMIANWGNIAYTITVLPACYFMDTKGLRVSLLGCTFLILVATVLRCITTHPTIATILINMCAALNGIAGTVPFAGPPLMAATWFPPHQRTTATAIASIWNYAGVAFAFILGPLLVSSPKYGHNTTTTQANLEIASVPTLNISTNASVLQNFDKVQTEVMHLMYIQCGAAGFLFLACFVYFPDKPPLPPSKTASLQRVEYKAALWKIMKHRSLWLITLAYAIPAGVFGVWGSVLDIILNPVGVDQTVAGLVGFYSTIAGCVSGFVIARFSDLFMRHMKLFLVSLFIMAAASCVWLTLLCLQYIPFTTAQLYTAGILLGAFLNGSIPLFYELSCEASYPVAEGVTGGFLTMLNNIFGILFLLVLLIPNIGTVWMNWCLTGSIGMGLLLLVLFPERYTRTDIDIEIKVDATDSETVTQVVKESQHVYHDGQIDNVHV